MRRFWTVLALLGALTLCLPAPAQANRSPGWLYFSEAAASIREAIRQATPPSATQVGAKRVGSCQRFGALKVRCIGEAKYTYYDTGNTYWCHASFEVTEARRSGRHYVRKVTKTACEDQSIFQP